MHSGFEQKPFGFGLIAASKLKLKDKYTVSTATSKTHSRNGNGAMYMPHTDSVRKDREIRYMSSSRARKAGEWTIKKYAGVFKKLADA